MIGCAGTFPPEEPVETDLWRSQRIQHGVQTYRLLTRPLHIDFQMILQILAHSLQIMNQINSQFREMIWISNSREL